MVNQTNMTIPVIDLNPLWENTDIGILEVAEQIRAAYTTSGFGYVINHRVPQSLIDNTFQQAMRFHNLPLEEKIKIKQNDCFRGYAPMNTSQLKVSTEGAATRPNQLEAFIMAFEVDENHPDYREGLYLAGPNQWPESLPGFKAVLCQYRDACLSLARQLLKPFGVLLCNNEERLKPFFETPTHAVRLQHYPPQPENRSENQFGIAPHTDYGFFTLLAQKSIAGLEVRTDDNDWVEVPPIEGALVLNTGDMLKRWSNDTIKSTPHRVINRSSCSRFSIPFFFEPDMHATIKIFDTCISEDSPAKHPPVMYGDYLLDRIQGNYGLGKKGNAA